MTGSVAVVTGASRGLGKAFSEALLKRGHKVFLCCIDKEQGNQTLQEFRQKYGDDRVDFQYCDVRQEQQIADVVSNAVKKYSRLDVMVNNAGIMNEREIKNTIDINLTAMMQGSMIALEYMKPQKSGLIINVSSIAGLQPVSFCPAYVASKYGVVAFSRSWGMHPDLTKNGIRMCCLCPSFADTAIIRGTEDKVHGVKRAEALINMYGIMKIDRVTEAFMKIVDDQDNNGKVMTVTPKIMDYYDFQEAKL